MGRPAPPADWKVRRSPQRRTRTKREQAGGTGSRASRQTSQLGVIEASVLVGICVGFVGLVAYTFSRPPAARPEGDPVHAVYAPNPADAPLPPAGRQGPPGRARWTPQRAVTAGGSGEFNCPEPRVTDGDTLRCGPVRVRLASIDAPEMPGHCRPGRACTPGDPFASATNLRRLVEGRRLTCRQTDIDHYGRVVALCSNGREDLSCSQVRSGHAVIRYGDLTCS